MYRKLKSITGSIWAARVFLLTVLSFPAMVSGADPLFLSDKIISMELRTDFSAIQAERKGTPSYHDGKLTYRVKGVGKVVLPVRVMARGNFRLNPDNCSFPPLFIAFKKNEVKSTLFRNQKKLKLVTPCQSEEDVLDEYTVYKMYNKVSDKSLNTRLVRMTYVDDGTGAFLFEKYSFFLEDKDNAAERINAKVVEGELKADDIDRKSYLRLAVFQYIIGNLDWSVTLGKNLIMMEPNDYPGRLFSIPYDFDFSAFVSAEYSKQRGIPENILAERRRYLGTCYTENELREVFDFYRQLKPAFESIIKKNIFHSNADRNMLLNYLDEFYATIEDSRRVKEEFLTVCGD